MILLAPLIDTVGRLNRIAVILDEAAVDPMVTADITSIVSIRVHCRLKEYRVISKGTCR